MKRRLHYVKIALPIPASDSVLRRWIKAFYCIFQLGSTNTPISKNLRQVDHICSRESEILKFFCALLISFSICTSCTLVSEIKIFCTSVQKAVNLQGYRFHVAIVPVFKRSNRRDDGTCFQSQRVTWELDFHLTFREAGWKCLMRGCSDRHIMRTYLDKLLSSLLLHYRCKAALTSWYHFPTDCGPLFWLFLQWIPNLDLNNVNSSLCFDVVSLLIHKRIRQ